MHKKGVAAFPHYFVGINSLSEVATKEDLVCVFNILGNESKSVTPISHAYSGGNIAFGTSPGRSGEVLKTPIGNIPVYNNIAEGMAKGHKFNVAVIYLPPLAVKDAVAEAVRVNPGLKKIIIITEKIPVRDARVIRAICQINGIDVFGANCLGVADSWKKVRLGGALGGLSPSESLKKGSVAIFSNSGNFTTTIAEYLQTEGWGTTTLISSGKDIYIYFAAPEFFNALSNDDRSKAAVIYIEPGGYYEAHLKISKPTIACIVGRWKARLTKACGHAGAIAGSGDNAISKEEWLKHNLDINELYTPQQPVYSLKGAVVNNISYIPEALTRVMQANGIQPDFEPKGKLTRKCWFANNQGIPVPKKLDIPEVEAIYPYNEQIKGLKKQLGAYYPRENMKDASNASWMNPVDHITRLHGISILDASLKSLEANLFLALFKKYPEKLEERLLNIALNAFVHIPGDPMIEAAEAARQAGCPPNVVLCAALSLLGKKRVEKALATMQLLSEIFANTALEDPFGIFDYSTLLKEIEFNRFNAIFSYISDPLAETMLKALNRLDRTSVLIRLLEDIARSKELFLSADCVLAAIWATLGWRYLLNKVISLNTYKNLPWYSRIISAMVGCSAPRESHGKDHFFGIKPQELIVNWSFTKIASLTLMGRKPTEKELFEFSLLSGLTISNSAGTISAQGSKGAVSADGPEDPSRVQINKAFVGFLSHTGFAHGGNGSEAISFLMEQFHDKPLSDLENRRHGLDLESMAYTYAKQYLSYKEQNKKAGNLDYYKIPCINHPVFKGKDINIDPREEYVRSLFQEHDIYNVFLDFYHHLVKALYKTGVSSNTYCVNIDAIIAVILLKLLWEPYTIGKKTQKDLEMAAFSAFLYGRMIGCAAEIDDHLNRGRNMDTRTPPSMCRFVE